jgi:methylamine dehydrogenase heavy chain
MNRPCAVAVIARTALSLALACALAGTAAAADEAKPAKGAAKAAKVAREVPPELPAETLQSNATLERASTERVYVADVMIGNIADGRLRVYDARTGRVLGMINTGFAGNFALSNKADEIYVATTYHSRGGRGERVDVFEVWDSNTLGFKHEVLLPPRRAQTLNYRGLVTTTANGRFALVQNATPATSITVVDLAEKKVAGEIQNPGCWGTLPAAGHATRFSMLCGDGKVATVTLDDKGAVADRQLSAKLFDPDTDAWFHTAERVGDRFFFVSFKGTLTELDLSGAAAKQVSQKALVTPAQAQAGWRPGGYQPLAVHPSGKWAVVAMHDKGREGSHKSPASQLWAFELDSGKRLAWNAGLATASLTFSKSGKRLQALDGLSSALRVWDWNDSGRLGQPVTHVKSAGMSAVELESHD